MVLSSFLVFAKQDQDQNDREKIEWYVLENILYNYVL